MKLFFIFLFIFFQFTKANIIIIDKKNNLYDNFDISYLKNDKKNYNINEIAKKDFKNTTSNGFTLSYTKGDIWFKFKLENKSEEENFIISLNEHFYEMANLYYYKNNKWIKKSSSLFDKIEDRETQSNENSFKIKLEKNEKQLFYLQLNAKFSYYGKLKIYKEKKFIRHSFTKRMILFFTFSLIFSLTCISFLLFVYLKEKIYFYYFAYSASTFVYFFAMNGFLVYLNLSAYLYKIVSISSLTTFFFILFSYEFLQVKKYMKKTYKYLLLVPFILVIFLTALFFSFTPWNSYSSAYNSFVMVFLVLLAVKAYSFNKDSKYYIMIFMIFFILVLVRLLMSYGVFEYVFFTRYASEIGVILENIAFLVFLIIKYHGMKENSIKAKDELIKIKTINQMNLEKEVKNRTLELRENRDYLKKLLLEKEFLLKELNHRVKNNFNLIIGLLHLEAANSSKNHFKFINIINRIKSMSNIHNYLYKDKDLETVNLKKYLEDILANFSSIYKNKEISLVYEIESIDIIINDAINLGIILNELLTNSIKHNKNENNLYIEISLKKEKKNLIFTICDSGKGFDLKQKNKGLGLDLIEKYSSSLKNSSYSFTFDKNTCFKLIFKI